MNSVDILLHSSSLASISVSFIVAAAASYPIYLALLALRSRQTVSQFVPEHAAKQGTPTMGGIITLVGFIAGCMTFAPVVSPPSASLGGKPQWAIPFLFLAFALIGFIDDFVVPRLMAGKRGLGWTQKLSMQVVFACVAVWWMGPGAFGAEAGVAVFLVLFFSNAYNFADGMDWLAGLLLLAIGMGLAPIADFQHLGGVVVYTALLCAASLPFLIYNQPKAKLFMGDVGALPIGALLGLLVSVVAMPALAPALSDYGRTASAEVLPLGLPPSWATFAALGLISLVMVAELVPVPLQILSVKLRGKRLFPMTPIHHAFQKAGWPEGRVVALFVGVQIAASIGGFAIAVLLGDSR